MIHAGMIAVAGVTGTIALASPPMHPGAASRLQQVWVESDGASAHGANQDGTGSEDWKSSEWLSRRFNIQSEQDNMDSSVTRRVQELQQEANQRWYNRRLDAGVNTIDGESYPQSAGWVSPDGEPNVQNWPWWLF